MNIEQLLAQAIDCHRRGQLQDAERLYHAILQVQPHHPDANHNLGVLAAQVNLPATGIPYFKRALEVNPNKDQFWLSYIDALIQTGQVDVAGEMLEQGRQRGLQGVVVEALAVRLEKKVQAVVRSINAEDDLALRASSSATHGGENPSFQEINKLGALFGEGRYTEAMPVALSMTVRFPTCAFGWKVLGVSLEIMGRSADALMPMRKTVELAPQDSEAHYNLGNTLRCLGQLDGAVASYRRALEVKPDYADACYNLGIVLNDLNQFEEAVMSYQRALKIRPDHAESHCNLASALRNMGELEAAVASYREALEIKPGFVFDRVNLGTTLHKLAGKNNGKAFCDEGRRNLQGVRLQYENLPFPARDLEAERYVLTISVPDMLGKINQYCFYGNKDYSKDFRILVAGCGTGDSVIWLAHQLKETNAEIVAIDLSEASLEIAKARAKVRNLANIKWVNGSLLDVSTLGLGRFDYITCLGVLHHLPDPVAGLIALESVLADGGAMAIMLYGAIGRSHIYVMQNILRQLTAEIKDPGECLAFAKKIVANLPATNGFRKCEGMKAINNQYLQDDTNFWDTLLHTQDCAYSASEVREFLASAGLFLQAFISYQGVAATTSLQYDLDSYIDDASQKERLKTLSTAERQNLAEALDGGLALHTVYATRSPKSSLSTTASNAILSPMSHSAQQIIAHLSKSDQAISIMLANGQVVSYKPSAMTKAFLANIDGYRSNAEIADLLGIKECSEELNLVNQELRIPTVLHWVIARTSAGSYLPPLKDICDLSFPLLRHYEPTSLPL